MIRVTGLDQIKALVADLEHDALLLERLSFDARYIAEASEDVRQSYREIWASQGGAIGEAWDTDLVQTGRLRDSLTGSSLQVTVTQDMILFGSVVPYADEVNARSRFAALTPDTVQDFADAVTDTLRTQGRLDWH